jgi:hypothetical protein
MTETATQQPTVTIGAPAPGRTPLKLPGIDTLNALNVCFMLTAVAGAASEYFGSTFGAVASMLAYLAYGLAFRKSVPNVERFADSVYYQGFILTLFALLIALTGRGATTLTSDGIINQFGLAIWTTFVGMFGRILIIQFLTTARDQDEEARQSIADYINELNREIETTLSQLRTFRESVVNSVSRVTDELADEAKRNRKDTNGAVKSATDALVRSVAQSTSKLDGSIDNLVARITNLEIPDDVLSAPIQRIADGMAADLNKLRSELDTGARNFAATLRDGLDERARSYETELDRISKGNIDAAKDAKDSVEQLTTALTDSLKKITDAVREAGR